MVVANNAYARQPSAYPYPNTQTHLRTKNRAVGRRIDVRLLRRIFVGVLVVFLALVVVYRYGQISKLNMQINAQTKTRNALIDEQRHLQITISELTALGRLERVAIEELGMGYPRSSQIRYVGVNNPESRDGDGS